MTEQVQAYTWSVNQVMIPSEEAAGEALLQAMNAAFLALNQGWLLASHEVYWQPHSVIVKALFRNPQVPGA